MQVALVTPVGAPGSGKLAAPPGVRQEFWDALHDASSIGLNLDDSFWPLSAEETNLLLQHMDSAEPLDLTPDEVDKMLAL